MNKESIYELQNIDCNCNDCYFLDRDLEKLNEWKEKQDEWDVEVFERKKEKLRLKASDNLSKGKVEVYKSLIKEADNLVFQPREKSKIAYGNCKKKNKEITFISNQCVIENQECFEHRIDYWEDEKKKNWFNA